MHVMFNSIRLNFTPTSFLRTRSLTFYVLLGVVIGLVAMPAPSNAAEDKNLNQGESLNHIFDDMKAKQSADAKSRLSFAPIVKQTAPAVVNIFANHVIEHPASRHPLSSVPPLFNDPFFQHFFGQDFPFAAPPRHKSRPQKQTKQSLGSGVIIDPSGYIITNSHVVNNAQDITIILGDGRDFKAEIKLEDPETDIALLKIIMDEPLENDGSSHVTPPLPYARFAPSENLEIGDFVVAIGNPFGVGQTVTSGIISAVARSALDINDFNFFIQTDAAINPGNSGGPLISMDGGIIGINTAIYSRSGGNLGIGFAVPSEIVAHVVRAYKNGQFKPGGGIIRPWLGVEAQSLSQDIAQSLGLKSLSGAIISDLHPHSPLLKAGLKSGDVIAAIDSTPIKSPIELRYRLQLLPLGQPAQITYFRGETSYNQAITMIVPPEKPARQITAITQNSPFKGVTIANINPALIHEKNITTSIRNGVVIDKITKNAPLRRLGLDENTLILKINDKEIENVDNMMRIIKKYAQKPPKRWVILVEIDGTTKRLSFR